MDHFINQNNLLFQFLRVQSSIYVQSILKQLSVDQSLFCIGSRTPDAATRVSAKFNSEAALRVTRVG